eukprot:1156167-Pelagomonas_calceolata.AAC.5
MNSRDAMPETEPEHAIIYTHACMHHLALQLLRASLCKLSTIAYPFFLDLNQKHTMHQRKGFLLRIARAKRQGFSSPHAVRITVQLPQKIKELDVGGKCGNRKACQATPGPGLSICTSRRMLSEPYHQVPLRGHGVAGLGSPGRSASSG